MFDLVHIQHNARAIFFAEKQQDDLETFITSLWVKSYNIEAHLLCGTQKLNILQDRLRDANESLTAQATSNIVSGSQNTAL